MAGFLLSHYSCFISLLLLFSAALGLPLSSTTSKDPVEATGDEHPTWTSSPLATTLPLLLAEALKNTTALPTPVSQLHDDLAPPSTSTVFTATTPTTEVPVVIYESDRGQWEGKAFTLTLTSHVPPDTTVYWFRLAPWNKTVMMSIGNGRDGCDQDLDIGLIRCTNHSLEFSQAKYPNSEGYYSAAFVRTAPSGGLRAVGISFLLTVFRPQTVLVPQKVASPRPSFYGNYHQLQLYLACQPLYEDSKPLPVRMDFKTVYDHATRGIPSAGLLTSPPSALTAHYEVRCCAVGNSWGIGEVCGHYTYIVLRNWFDQNKTGYRRYCPRTSQGYNHKNVAAQPALTPRGASQCLVKKQTVTLVQLKYEVCETSQVIFVPPHGHYFGTWTRQVVPTTHSCNRTYAPFTEAEYVVASNTSLVFQPAERENAARYIYSSPDPRFPDVFRFRLFDFRVEQKLRVFIHLEEYQVNHVTLSCRHNLPPHSHPRISWEVRHSVPDYKVEDGGRKLKVLLNCWHNFWSLHSLYHIRCSVRSDLQQGTSSYFVEDSWKGLRVYGQRQ